MRNPAKGALWQLALIVGILCLMAGSGNGQEPEVPKIKRASTESYEDMLRKVHETDSGINYKEFRLAYADSSAYKPNADPEMRQAMFGALSAKDYGRASELAEAILKDRYVDIYAHQVAAVAFRELGDRAKSTIDRKSTRLNSSH